MRLIATFALLAACGCSARPPAEGDAAGVYDAFLGADFVSPSGRVLLQDVTKSVTADFFEVRIDPSRAERMRLLPDVQQAVDDLIARGRLPQPLPAEVQVSADQIRISADSATAIMQSAHRLALHRLPDRASVFQLSSVGFNRRRDVAVVYSNVVCGNLCGGAVARVVRRYPDGWLPAEELFSVVY